ncbi:hypothetical protein O3M35_009345 [Rhynocoris fuscipes]|uniref:Kazal-like domain-containing protein n=1 Tax=Rhynocoris fuscipes TaxID=488301 RepID=A0AAW1D9J2_9HEMI
MVIASLGFLVITLSALITSSNADTECSSICPDIYQPLCAVMGNNMQTFGNSCVLGVRNKCSGENWVVISNYACNFSIVNGRIIKKN